MSRRVNSFVLLAAAALIAAAGRQPALSAVEGQQAPVYRSGVQVVEVDARVFDRDGHFVRTLGRADFEILEDGVPQQIVAMTLVDLLSAVRTPPTFPQPPGGGPRTVGERPAVAPAGHTWVFFFDLNHLTPGAGFERARKAVEDFIATRFTQGDLAGVIAGDKMVNNRLTTVREELVAAVKSVKPRDDIRSLAIESTREWPRFRDNEEALRVARNERDAIAAAVTRACNDDSTQCQRAEGEVRSKGQRIAGLIQNMTMATFNSINAMASGLARMAGPKTIVFLSDGFVTSGMETTLRSIVGQSARAGARVYAIDVRGLGRGMGSTADQMQTDSPSGSGPRFDSQSDGVNSLAVDTGGMMIRNENNIGRALDAIAADTNSYYVLGYQPLNTNFDGKYRKIQIRVKRDGLKVRARQGYLALEPSKMLKPEPIK